MRWEIGARVRVSIKDRTGWVDAAVDSMNGATGVVESESPVVDPWDRPQEPVYGVRFDAPCTPWNSSQLEVTAFHFSAHELEAEDPTTYSGWLSLATSADPEKRKRLVDAFVKKGGQVGELMELTPEHRAMFMVDGKPWWRSR